MFRKNAVYIITPLDRVIFQLQEFKALWGSFHLVEVNVFNCDIIVSEFEIL